MASSKKASSKKTSKSSAKNAKPTAAKRLHKTAKDQLNAVARGEAGQKKAKPKPTPVRSTKKSITKKAGGALSAVKKAVRSAAAKVTSAIKPGKKKAATTAAASRPKTEPRKAPARKVQRVSDVDASKLDDLGGGQASSKFPFDTKRSDAFAEQDIRSALSTDDEWQNEDHLTNKTGDKRIGTKGRKYQ